MALTVQNVYGLLLRSKLMGPKDAKALFDRWQREAKGNATDLERFRRWLIGQRYLTDYQANLLCKGHADGFFIDEYKILDRLGRGRMAGVYKAVHRLGQVVAIKVLPPSKAKVAYLLSRFEREARLATQLTHPNVVRTYQWGQASGLHYIVMEYLEGETLDDVITRRRRLPPSEAVRLSYQTLQGLQHIHERGMIHRDLKPSNMMLTPARAPGQPDTTVQQTLKILDIGLGRMFFDESVPTQHENVQDQLTGEGVLLGTPDYLAPEQARDARGVDIRADIYSVGCVLYHCLSGRPPFPDTNILNQIIRHAQETPKALRDFNPDVSDSLQQVIDVLMAKDLNQRYPTPAQAAQALLPFLSAGGAEPSRFDEDMQMRQYLNWVESRSNPGVAQLAKAVAGAEPKPARSTGSSHSGRKHRKKKRRGYLPEPMPPGVAAGMDVELIPAEQPARKRKHRHGRSEGSSRRLFIVAGLAAAAAVAAGGFLAYVTRPQK